MLTEALRSEPNKIQNYDIMITLAKAPQKAPCSQNIAPLFYGELMAEYNGATCKSPVVFVTLCRLNSHVATDAASAASVSGNAILFERARGAAARGDDTVHLPSLLHFNLALSWAQFVLFSI